MFSGRNIYTALKCSIYVIRIHTNLFHSLSSDVAKAVVVMTFLCQKYYDVVLGFACYRQVSLAIY